jgi:hypothetical protein
MLKRVLYIEKLEEEVFSSIVRYVHDCEGPLGEWNE